MGLLGPVVLTLEITHAEQCKLMTQNDLRISKKLFCFKFYCFRFDDLTIFLVQFGAEELMSW